MEMVVGASGVISAVVGVAAFLRVELRRRRAQRARQRLLDAAALGSMVVVMVWMLRGKL